MEYKLDGPSVITICVTYISGCARDTVVKTDTQQSPGSLLVLYDIPDNFLKLSFTELNCKLTFEIDVGVLLEVLF